MIQDDFDIVIVGAGVAGGALATRLARDGFSVLVLERTLAHVDRIRCEFDAQAAARRVDVARTLARDPGAFAPLIVPFVGPFGTPAETFEEPAVRRLFGDDWSLSEDGWCSRMGQGEASALAV
jgi:choline dehydrogenase-like flavoprotein